jgi:hypothetical protein
MKTTFLKSILLIIATLCFFSAETAYIPMPIYHHYSGGGHITGKELVGMLIAFNVIFLTIYFIRSVIWFYEKPIWSYREYVIWSDANFLITEINTIGFVVVNGISALILLAAWITNLL